MKFLIGRGRIGEKDLVAGPEGTSRGRGAPVTGRTGRRSRGGTKIVIERDDTIR